MQTQISMHSYVCARTVRLGRRRKELQKPRKRSLTLRGSRTWLGLALGLG